jgi:hypothetical protein
MMQALGHTAIFGTNVIPTSVTGRSRSRCFRVSAIAATELNTKKSEQVRYTLPQFRLSHDIRF